jgi:hypothetical protein
MPTHLYCLLPAPSKLAPPAGVHALDAGDVQAWVANTEVATLSRDARDLSRATIEHDRIVSAALAQGVTPIPAALADAYEDDDAASRDFSGYRDDIRRALDRVRDMVEMTVIIAVDDAAPPGDAAGRGRAYLEQLRAVPSRAGAIADRISAVLTPLAGLDRRRADGGRVGLSHLVARRDIDGYRRLALSQAGDGYRIVIDGPRAPYSFARFSPRHGILTEGTASAA